MSMRTKLPWSAAAATTRRAWPSASARVDLGAQRRQLDRDGGVHAGRARSRPAARRTDRRWPGTGRGSCDVLAEHVHGGLGARSGSGGHRRHRLRPASRRPCSGRRSGGRAAAARPGARWRSGGRRCARLRPDHTARRRASTSSASASTAPVVAVIACANSAGSPARPAAASARQAASAGRRRPAALRRCQLLGQVAVAEQGHRQPAGRGADRVQVGRGCHARAGGRRRQPAQRRAHVGRGLRLALVAGRRAAPARPRRSAARSSSAGERRRHLLGALGQAQHHHRLAHQPAVVRAAPAPRPAPGRRAHRHARTRSGRRARTAPARPPSPPPPARPARAWTAAASRAASSCCSSVTPPVSRPAAPPAAARARPAPPRPAPPRPAPAPAAPPTPARRRCRRR